MIGNRILVATAGLFALSACTGHSSLASFPTPGSYNPLATTNPIDPGLVAVGREIRETDRSIDDARDGSRLSKRDARSLKRANGALAATAARMGEDGLSADEQRSLELQARLIGSVAGAVDPAGRSPASSKPKDD